MNRVITVSILAALLFGCSHGVTSTVPTSGVAPKQKSGSPFIVQTGAVNGWVTVPISQSPAGEVLGSDGAIWMTAAPPAQTVMRVDLGGNETDFSIDGSPNSVNVIVPNADGNLYFAELFQGSQAVAKLTMTGQVTDFIIPGSSGIVYMAAGSDGNIWMTRYDHPNIGRLTPEGTYTAFDAPFDFFGPLVSGPDENLWTISGDQGGPVFVRVAVNDGSFTTFSLPNTACRLSLIVGADHGLWFAGFQKHPYSHNMYRADTNGNVVGYPINEQGDFECNGGVVSGPNHRLYWWENRRAGEDVLEWNEVTHRIASRQVTLNHAFLNPMAIGGDGQLWAFNYASQNFPELNVLILHPIVVNPSQIVVNVNATLPFTVTEQKSTQRSFTAISNNTNIATVSGSGKSFTVTGVAHGNTTITVSDQIGNSLDVPVTVN